MTPITAVSGIVLADAVATMRLPEELIQQRVRRIQQDLLAHSHYLRESDFTAIHPGDREFLFDTYNKQFFNGLCRQALAGRRLSFRLAPRMTRVGGKTVRFTTRTGEVRYEIAIASSILFDGFGERDRSVSVCGLECENRLEALQRVFEHELVHLIEQLCWHSSNCAAPRFRNIATSIFLHRTHTHDLITRRERALVSGIRIGSPVTFMFEGRRLTGRVNRITKRATVLVEDPDGMTFSDGLRYRTYYVSIACLELIEGRATSN